MSPKASDSSIQFKEVSSRAADFLHELNDPEILRNRKIPPAASIELRKEQVARLRENIGVLEAKRDEFNRKMEEYIQNLASLVRGIEKGIAAESNKLESGAAVGQDTLVRCLGCESEAIFRGLQIIFARESNESFTLPTEVYVLEGARLKKGHFSCSACGSERLVIRAG
jgi:hypothetical protein